MLVLALDTATAAVTAGLISCEPDHDQLPLRDRVARLADNVVAVRVTRNARAHGESLTPGIQECLTEAGVKPADVEAVVVGVGPGPFTGLRVGLVTAGVFADVVACPTYAVCSLDAIAASALGEKNGPFLVATDARRREIYWACYGESGERRVGPGVSHPTQVRLWLDGQPRETLFEQKDLAAHDDLWISGPDSIDRPQWAAGAGAALYEDVLDRPVLDVDPTAHGLVACAWDRLIQRLPSEELVPLYLRRPDVT